MVPVPTKNVTELTEMLGLYFAPVGNGFHHMEVMKKKGLQWLDRLKTRPLPSRDAWAYGLASVVLSPSKLEKLVRGVYLHALPLLGINRCITTEWTMLPPRYQGLGMPNFVIDCFALKVFFIQCCWDYDCPWGQLMVHAYEAMMVEVGLYGNLLTQDYDSCSHLATKGTWWKNFWEYADYLGIQVELSEEFQLSPIRANDSPIMQLLDEAGLANGADGKRLNRIRHYKCVIHVSDMVSCDGKLIESSMLDDLRGETSSITFPEESPTRSDFQYWRDCLRAITSASHTFGQVLGPYVAKSHVHHRWFVADDEGELFYRFEDNGENMHSVFAKEQAAYDTRFGR